MSEFISEVINKDDLVNFLVTYHKQNYNSEITPIKLQKALYFLYAYYIKYTHLISEDEKNDLEDYGYIPPELFKPNFEAWDYGPVDPDVYRKFKANGAEEFMTGSKLSEVLNVRNDFIEEFIYNFTQQIFNSGDFGLVELSHRDEAWKNHHSLERFSANRKIPSEEIIEEYSRK